MFSENTLHPDFHHYLDTGVPCSLAYCKIHNVKMNPITEVEVYQYCNKYKYRKVFLLQPNVYEHDYARTESAEDRSLLYFSLRNTYTSLGYSVIEIPQMPIPERARMILSNCCINALPMIAQYIESLFGKLREIAGEN